MTASVCLAAMLLGGALALQPVRISADKLQSFAPLDVKAQVIIPRHAENRRVCVTLSYAGEKEDFGCLDLMGERSSPIWVRTWRMVEPGQHFAQATLYRSNGHPIYSNVIAFRVAGEE